MLLLGVLSPRHLRNSPYKTSASTRRLLYFPNLNISTDLYLAQVFGVLSDFGITCCLSFLFFLCPCICFLLWKILVFCIGYDESAMGVSTQLRCPGALTDPSSLFNIYLYPLSCLYLFIHLMKSSFLSSKKIAALQRNIGSGCFIYSTCLGFFGNDFRDNTIQLLTSPVLPKEAHIAMVKCCKSSAVRTVV